MYLSTACSSFGLCLWGGISLQWYQNSVKVKNPIPPVDSWSTVGRQSVDSWSTVGRQTADRWPTVDRLSADALATL